MIKDLAKVHKQYWWQNHRPHNLVVSNLENPMCTTKEPCNSQSKYIMCCEWFNNLRRIVKVKKDKLWKQTTPKQEIIVKRNFNQDLVLRLHLVYLSVLHHTELGEYWNRFQINTKGPTNPIEKIVLRRWMNSNRQYGAGYHLELNHHKIEQTIITREWC